MVGREPIVENLAPHKEKGYAWRLNEIALIGVK
jgi:hypothetical protein